MKNLLLLLLIFLSHSVFTQDDPIHENYSWSKTPNLLTNIDSEDKSIIQLKSKFLSEFLYSEDGTLAEYNIQHNSYWLNSDEEIENYNKVYIPYDRSSTILQNKARVINKNGVISVLDESKIMTAKNEETGQEYKYFAFEGIEKGSIIEYFWIIEKDPDYSGSRITLQNENEKYNIDFDLYAPKNLLFKFKSYNGLDSVTYDTIIEKKQHWSIHIDHMKKLQDEGYSAYHANKQFLIYKLYYNSVNGSSNLISYSNNSKDIFNYLNKEISKKNKKKVSKILEKLELSIARDYSAKIRVIEDYIKNNIYVVNSYTPELGDLTTVLDKKIANKYGILRLFIEMFNQEEIKHEIVVTSNRFNLKFDKDFEAYNFLTDYLFYFPKIDEFLSPEGLSNRLGYPDTEFSECYGLFIKKVQVGDFTSGVGKIKYIKGVEYKKNFDNILVDVTFDKEDFTTTLLTIDRSSGGYYVSWLQPQMHLLKDKEEVIEEQIKFIKKDIEILSKTVYNDDAKFFGKEPLRIVAKGKSSSFVEKAGNNYLVKVGEFIGEQHEMYQEKKRQQPIETYYRKNYHRVIKVTIPEGYTIKNLDEVNINESFTKETNKLMKFESSYTLEGNKLIITADEFYDFIRLEKKYYDDYRRVMNAAADFNKVTLILQEN
jgi:hypothetical protein